MICYLMIVHNTCRQAELPDGAEVDIRSVGEGDGPHLLHGRLQPQGGLFLLDAEHDCRSHTLIPSLLNYTQQKLGSFTC